MNQTIDNQNSSHTVISGVRAPQEAQFENMFESCGKTVQSEVRRENT